MRLKSLELIGFKSFADRTIINFEEGITGVVGPNGCGKSNVVDAIRWVMGEMSAKHLRGSAMEDVIFNGSEKRSAMGLSAVNLTFDNADGRAPAEYAAYTEITVGRRLFRSGESEYTINKTPCRHKDIIDLFLGTGVGTKAYSIIEQGRIGLIVSSKPEERRYFIEEAAGISKFKARKEAALRKVEATKSNLMRLTDIISELDRQLSSLSRQAKKAERYQEYFNALKAIELQVSAFQWQEENRACIELEAKVAGLREQEASDMAVLSAVEADIESGRLSLAEVERLVSDMQERVYALQNSVRMLETELGYQKKEVEDLESRIQSTTVRDTELSQKLEGLIASQQATVEQQALVTSDLNERREAIKSDEGALLLVTQEREATNTAIQVAQQEMLRVVETIAQAKGRQDQIAARVSDLMERKTKANTRLGELDARQSEVNTQVFESEESLAGTRQAKSTVAAKVEDHGALLKSAKEDQREAQMRLGSLKDNLQQKRSRLESLQELQRNFEGYQEGVRSILKHRQETADLNLLGTISECLSTSSEYEAAVSAVLGDRLQYVVVDTIESGTRAIDYLKNVATGRGSFIPSKLLRDFAEAPLPSDATDVVRASDVVQCRNDLYSVVRYLIGNVWIVNDLASAVKWRPVCPANVTLVTRDGDVIDPAGVMTGGKDGDASQQFLSRKREIAELEVETADLQNQLQSEEQELGRISHRIQSLTQEVEQLARDSHAEDLKLVHQEKDVGHLRQELVRIQAEITKLQQDISAADSEISQIQGESIASRDEVVQLDERRATLEGDLVAHKTVLSRLDEDIAQRQTSLTSRKTELATQEAQVKHVESELQRISSQIEEARGELARGQKLIVQSSARVDELRSSQVTKSEELQSSVEQLSAKQEEHRQLAVQFQEKQDSLRNMELKSRDLRSALDKVRGVLHEADLDSVRRNEKRAALERDVFEKYRVDLPQLSFDESTLNMPMEQAVTEVAELKDKLSKLGSVNVDAIQEFAELTQRYDFLQQQNSDLTQSLDDLQKAIQKINRTSRERFRETFDLVNDSFKMLFPRLFKGGKAQLLLTDEDNILESGVEIVAQPPGKKLQSVSLLSGGEKALTAIAFVFAIFLIKPSPFCLLDEVDAPLDDVNVDRFNDMIRQMMGHSQFILITHNKRTMELADTLYGVTMQEPGVSRLVSVKLGGREVTPADKDKTAAA